MAGKFFTGQPLNGPDSECVKGFGEIALSKIYPGRISKARRATTTSWPPAGEFRLHLARHRRRRSASICDSQRSAQGRRPVDLASDAQFPAEQLEPHSDLLPCNQWERNGRVCASLLSEPPAW
jgi:hypothetical protein